MRHKLIEGALWAELKKARLDSAVAALLCFSDHPMSIKELQQRTGQTEQDVREDLLSLRRVGYLQMQLLGCAGSFDTQQSSLRSSTIEIGYYLEAEA